LREEPCHGKKDANEAVQKTRPARLEDIAERERETKRGPRRFTPELAQDRVVHHDVAEATPSNPGNAVKTVGVRNETSSLECGRNCAASAAWQAFAVVALEQATKPKPELPTLLPEGALLSIEARDFASLLHDWNTSK